MESLIGIFFVIFNTSSLDSLMSWWFKQFVLPVSTLGHAFQTSLVLVACQVVSSPSCLLAFLG